MKSSICNHVDNGQVRDYYDYGLYVCVVDYHWNIYSNWEGKYRGHDIEYEHPKQLQGAISISKLDLCTSNEHIVPGIWTTITT